MNFLFNLNPIINLLIIIVVTLLLFRLCYFFEGFSKFPISNLAAILSLMFIAVYMSLKTLYGIYHFKRLKEDYGLTEGKIMYYKSGRGKALGEVEFEYLIKDELISNNVSENDFVEIPDIKPDTIIRYLVIYEQRSPQNSFLLFNYPINDNGAMKQYQRLFSKAIPKDVFN
ncbi:hypothetical protein [Flavobacterium reichenbachii]|uniref:Transmembrane protein n=1 Tax=Flavobacterium reichenbachii TaxID=362418 RepID=A0A085ZDC4_9FLAO|nr:hypothetical protein [Flavobacterium reichenbachii]KFF02438.1 hypothetical protein IW19_24415 [Flavobacterium reichenbachii]OXB13584.1 hypothetical protein B0A68_14635 [Flavobacterium reichenbachii]